MESLSSLPNISKAIENKLIEAGITSPQELSALGSRAAFQRIRAIDSTACVNMLCALEGAIEGIRWHHLPDGVKADLKHFYQNL